MIAIQQQTRFADGPCECGGKCQKCHELFSTDIYHYQGWVLCGECRYFVRHNKHPSREGTSTSLPLTSETQYSGRGNAELNNRFEVLVVQSKKHADLLMEWIGDCSLSID